MTLTKQTIIIFIIFIVLILIVVFAYRIDGFCNCTGFGVQVDKPTNTFWRGAWPRSKSAIDLNSSSNYGTYPAGCNSPGLGWPQMSERPFNRSHYDYASISDPYSIGSNEIRDLARDSADGLLDGSKIQATYGQQIFEIPFNYSAIPSAAKCCDCGPTKPIAAMQQPSDAAAVQISASTNGVSNGGGCGAAYGVNNGVYTSNTPSASSSCSNNGQQYYGRFLPLASIPCSSLPPGAVTAGDPNMSAYENQLRFGTGRYDDLAIGVL